MVGAREKKGKECELMMMDGGDELNGDPSNFPYRVSDWDRVCVSKLQRVQHGQHTTLHHVLLDPTTFPPNFLTNHFILLLYFF